MELINEWCIRTDIKAMQLRDRVLGALYSDDGIETGEVVVLLAIFALIAAGIAKVLGVSLKDKAAEIANNIGGATWTP